MGNGKKKVFKTEKELFDFLSNSKDGGYMWRDHEDFAAICNIYQLNIKIITVKSSNDPNPIVSYHEPDPNFKTSEFQFPPGKISDMILYHVKDVHFDLIAKKDSAIVEEGGLDFQRKTKSEENSIKNRENDDREATKNENELLERKISKLENELEFMKRKLDLLEAEKNENAKSFKGKDYNCYECDNTYNTKTLIREHMKTHIEPNCNVNEQKGETFTCTKCKAQFNTNRSFEDHISTHNQNNCEKCGTFFWTEHQLGDHIKEHHSGKEHHCEYCNLSFNSESSLAIHSRNQHEGKDVSTQNRNICVICGQVFLSEAQLDKHMETQHLEEKLEFSCSKCKSIFSSEKRLEDHMENHVRNQCERQQCGKIFISNIQLENHLVDEHKDEAQKFSKQYNCKDCSFQGDNWSDLKKHIQSKQHNAVEFSEKCYTCGEEFSTYWSLMDHRKKRHPSTRKCRYFLRQECFFNAERCWYSHDTGSQETRNNEQQLGLSCRECEQTFPNRSELMFHKKKEHFEKVEKCWKFLQGKCVENANLCWFKHEEKKKDYQTENMEIEVNSPTKSDFQKVKEITPPDPLKTIMEMVTRLMNQKNQ